MAGTCRLTIDGQRVEVRAGSSLMEAARAAGRYVPGLCHHPDLPPGPQGRPNASHVYRGSQHPGDGSGLSPYAGCGLCWVEVEGQAEPVRACMAHAVEGMLVRTDAGRLQSLRQRYLKDMLADHPHACILCPLRQGCDRLTCSMGVPPEERCCDIFNRCEIRFVSEHIGILPDTPKYRYRARPVLRDEPLLAFDWNLCIGCTRCVRVCRDVRGVEALGFVSDDAGRPTVGSKGPTLNEAGCIFCGACLTACPSGAIMDKEGQKARDAERPIPCIEACPAGIDVPRYLRFIAEGRYPQALAVVRQKVPFPGVLGHVCHHPCEAVCRRGQLNQPVSICRLKRFAAERDDGAWKRLSKPKPDTGKRVAVVGSGPAGLTVAYYLSKQGHAVTVFEALPQAGGMLRYGMPPFRLPRQVLDEEIREIEALGVQIRTNTPIEALDDLFQQGFDAVFLGVGAHRARALGIPGEELTLPGVSFLREVNLGQSIAVGRRVAVIGGGNVAADAARTALRLGAREVTVLYRRSRALMPALTEEMEHALSEGARLREWTLPLRVERGAGGLKLRCARTEVKNQRGKSAIAIVPHSEVELTVDLVISAIGQAPEVPSAFGLTRADDGAIEVERDTSRTSRAGVFAGGDATGSTSVIEAIAWGRRAAQAMDRYLGGDGNIEERLLEEQTDERSRPIRGFAAQRRANAGCLALEQRLAGLSPVVELGYTEAQARYEARRCLRCDLRLKLACVPLPPRSHFKPLSAEAVEAVPAVEGVYRLYDEGRQVLVLKGVPDLRAALRQQLGHSRAIGFDYEQEPLYTQRESELLQQYLQGHGRLPGGEADGLDDLY